MEDHPGERGVAVLQLLLMQGARWSCMQWDLTRSNQEFVFLKKMSPKLPTSCVLPSWVRIQAEHPQSHIDPVVFISWLKIQAKLCRRSLFSWLFGDAAASAWGRRHLCAPTPVQSCGSRVHTRAVKIIKLHFCALFTVPLIQVFPRDSSSGLVFVLQSSSRVCPSLCFGSHSHFTIIKPSQTLPYYVPWSWNSSRRGGNTAHIWACSADVCSALGRSRH